MTGIFLGYIKSVELGFKGPGEEQFGFLFQLAGGGLGVDDFWPIAAGTIEEVEDCCRAAKVQFFSQLRGKPVQVTVDENLLKRWRILHEVIP